jgi:hypothetical protein
MLLVTALVGLVAAYSGRDRNSTAK